MCVPVNDPVDGTEHIILHEMERTLDSDTLVDPHPLTINGDATDYISKTPNILDHT